MLTKITTSDRRDVATLANALHYQTGLTLSAAWLKAWTTIKLKKAMRAGTVEFTYTKKDGSARAAVGTLSPALATYTPKGAARNYSPLYVRYFDLEKQSYRQFAAASLQ